MKDFSVDGFKSNDSYVEARCFDVLMMLKDQDPHQMKGTRKPEKACKEEALLNNSVKHYTK